MKRCSSRWNPLPKYLTKYQLLTANVDQIRNVKARYLSKVKNLEAIPTHDIYLSRQCQVACNEAKGVLTKVRAKICAIKVRCLCLCTKCWYSHQVMCTIVGPPLLPEYELCKGCPTHTNENRVTGARKGLRKDFRAVRTQWKVYEAERTQHNPSPL